MIPSDVPPDGLIAALRLFPRPETIQKIIPHRQDVEEGFLSISLFCSTDLSAS